MTKFKVFELDGYFEFTVATNNVDKAVQVLRRTFGTKVQFMIML